MNKGKSIKNRVHIQKCTNQHKDVLSAMEAIGWRDIVHEGDKVAIKVNIADNKPKRGVNTTPELVYEVIKILQDRKCVVSVVESNNLFFSIESAYRETGLQPWIEKAGAEFVSLSSDKKLLVHPDNTLFVKEYTMPEILQEADVIITMPLLKTHEITLYTGALKNQFGCYPQYNRVLLHPHLDEAIVDINTILKPQIVIMDALIGIEGNGPSRGYPVKMDLIITANNVVSCDLVALKIIGFDLNEVKHVLLAKNVNKDADNYELTGEPIENIKREFKRPYNDLANRGQNFIFKHKVLTKLLFDTYPGRKIVRAVGFYRRKWALRGKTEYF